MEVWWYGGMEVWRIYMYKTNTLKNFKVEMVLKSLNAPITTMLSIPVLVWRYGGMEATQHTCIYMYMKEQYRYPSSGGCFE